MGPLEARSDSSAPDSGPRFAGTSRTVRVNIQRRRGSLHDLLRDHHFLDALKARQLEHGIEQDDLHDKAYPVDSGSATCCGLNDRIRSVAGTTIDGQRAFAFAISGTVF